jgi:hypothetical protein
VNALTVFYILAGLASIVGLLLYFKRRPERRKGLTYGIEGPIQIARFLPAGKGNRLSLVYEGEGRAPENVKGAYLQYVGIANLGSEPIRREDLVEKDPLRLEVTGGRVLDVSIDRVKREVTDFRFTHGGGSETTSTYVISFAFLDFQDGALIRVLTDSGKAKCQVMGTIIGMPHGIETPRVRLPENKMRTWTGVALSLLLYALALAAGFLLIASVTHRPDLWWLWLVPLASLAIPGAIILLVSQTIWPHGKGWPPALMLPGWLHFSGATPALDGRFMFENADDYMLGRTEDEDQPED